MALITIDFDNTIASLQTFPILMKAITLQPTLANDPEALWKLVKSIPAIQYADSNRTITWKTLIEKMIAEEHQVAIASFNSFGNMLIPRYLKEVIGLSDEIISKIIVNAWLPLNPDQANKNEHIWQIKDKASYRHLLATIVMVDDDDKRVLPCALERGFSIVKADDRGSHLRCLNDMVLPSLQPESVAFEKFKQNQKPFPHGFDFSGGIAEYDYVFHVAQEKIEEKTEEKTELEKTPKTYDIQFVSSQSEAIQVTASLQNGLILTASHQLYFVEKSALFILDVKQDAIARWLSQYGYQDAMKASESNPISMLDQITNHTEAYRALQQFCCSNFAPMEANTSSSPSSSSSASLTTTQATLFNEKQEKQVQDSNKQQPKPLQSIEGSTSILW